MFKGVLREERRGKRENRGYFKGFLRALEGFGDFGLLRDFGVKKGKEG